MRKGIHSVLTPAALQSPCTFWVPEREITTALGRPCNIQIISNPGQLCLPNTATRREVWDHPWGPVLGECWGHGGLTGGDVWLLLALQQGPDSQALGWSHKPPWFVPPQATCHKSKAHLR